jgi:ATP/maltotriose-dependent transcriptional regulator MalT
MLLLERDAELRAILDHVQAVRDGRGSAVAISGEAGSGKTAILNAALASIRESEVDVLAARCFRDDDGTPFAVLQRLVASAPELSPQLPQPIGTAPEQFHSEDALRRQIVTTLATARSQRPLVIAIDDLQWIDGPSGAVVRSLSHLVPAKPLILLFAVLEPSSENGQSNLLTSTLLTESNARMLSPLPLSPAAVRAIVGRSASTPNDRSLSALASEIYRLTSGNPFFASELAAAARSFRPDSAPGSSALPASIRHAISVRMGTLAQATVTLLEYASLFPRGIREASLDSILDAGGSSADESIGEALHAGFLTSSPEFGVQFRHEIIRMQLVERQSAPQRRERHAEILTALRDAPETSAADLAYHAAQAERYDEAFEHFERAGHEAIRYFALDEAARYFELASTAAERAGADEPVRDRIRLALAGSLILIDPERADREISSVIERAVAREDELTLARARQRRAIIIYQAGQIENVLPLLGQALPVLERHEEHQALAEGYAYVGYCGSVLNDYALVLRATEQLEALSEVLDNPMYRAVALNLRAVALVARGERVGTAPYMARDSVSITSAIGRIDLATAFAGVAFSSVDYWSNLDHPDMVDELVLRASALAARSWDAEEFPGSMRMLWQLGWSFLRGDWQRVRNELPDLELVRNASIPQVYKDTVHNVAAELAWASGDAEQALDYLRYVARTPDTLNGRHAYRQWLLSVEHTARINIERRESERARRWIDTLDRALESHPYLPGEHLLELSRARLACATQDYPAARTLLGELIAAAERVNNWIVVLRGLILHADVLSHCDEIAAAERAATRAIEASVRLRLPWEEACARLARAGLGSAQSVDLRLDDVGEATAIGERLGAAALIAAAERLRLQLTDRDRPGGLTRRELDVLALVASGMTDHEIAERLFISPRTVGTHISNMLNKTTTNNRVELATWAISNELVSPQRSRR